MENEDTVVNQDLIDRSLRMYDKSTEQKKQKKEEDEATEAFDAEIEIQQEDPRDAESWGLPAVAEELKAAVTGGIQDTASSIQTFPERAIDTLSGEVSREKKEKGFYEPEWTVFVDKEDPILTKTWWGQLLRGTVHFGTMAAGVIGTAKAAAITAPAWLSSMTGYSLIRAAGIGAVSDTISHTTDGEKALGMMRDRFGWMDTPLSTRDTDHPLMMKFKNIVEGMGIGILFDSAALALGKGGSYAKSQVLNRNNSVELQTIRKASIKR
jgi:hypothetical protein